MQLSLHVHNLDLRSYDGLFTYAARRADAALGRLADRVANVILRLSDENGPKGGPAMRCVAEIRWRGGGGLVVQDRSATFGDAISRALERGAAVARRAVGRRRALERR